MYIDLCVEAYYDKSKVYFTWYGVLKMAIHVICEEIVMKMINFDCSLNQNGGFSKCLLFIFWSFVLYCLKKSLCL